jgi:hypothetical protein
MNGAMTVLTPRLRPLLVILRLVRNQRTLVVRILRPATGDAANVLQRIPRTRAEALPLLNAGGVVGLVQ